MPLPPTIFLITVSCGFFEFVNVHVTVEPGAMSTASFAYGTSLLPWSLQETDGAFQTLGSPGVSVTV